MKNVVRRSGPRFFFAVTAFSVGCSIDTDISGGAVISCDTQADCPEGSRCTEFGRCIALGGDDVLPGLVADSLVVPSYLGRDQSIDVSFDVTEVLASEPVVELSWGGTTPGTRRMQPLAAGNDGYTLRYTAQHAGADPDPEVLADVVISLTDLAGNIARIVVSRAVTFDFTLPAVVDATVQLTPDTQNPLLTVSALRNGTSLTALVYFNEALAEPPQLRGECGTFTLPIARDTAVASNTYARFQHVLDADDGAPDGECLLIASLRDPAGNLAEAILADTLLIDRIAPDSSSIDPSRVRHLRVPWGAQRNGHQRGHYLVDIDHGASDPLPFIPKQLDCAASGVVCIERELAIEAPSSVPRGEVDTLRVWAGGLSVGQLSRQGELWPPVRLDTPDEAAISLTAVDGAGNESEPTPVNAVTWVATLDDKEAGSSLANPHEFWERPIFNGALDQSGEHEVGGQYVGRPGDQALITQGAGDWLQGNHIQVRGAGLAQIYDAWRGNVVVVQEGALARWNGTTWHAEPTNDTAGDGDPDMSSTWAPVFDTRRGRILIVNGGFDASLTTWEWTGEGYTRTCDGPNRPSCALTAVIDRGLGVTWDERRGRAIAYGWNVDDPTEAFTYAWSNETWSSTSPTSPAARERYAMAYDEGDDQVVMIGGCFVDGAACQSGGAGSCSLFGTSCGDIVAFKNGVWSDLSGDTNPPPARHDANLVYDSVGDRLLYMMGRSPVDCDGDGGEAACIAVWQRKDGVWSQLALADPEGDGFPSPRHSAAATYDAARQRVVVTGGVSVTLAGGNGASCNGPTCDSTWELILTDPPSWRLAKAVELNDSAPVQHEGATMIFNGLRKELVLFGGRAGVVNGAETPGLRCSISDDSASWPYCADVWIYRGRWTNAGPLPHWYWGAPGALWSMGAADNGAGGFWFGGHYGGASYNAGPWTLSVCGVGCDEWSPYLSYGPVGRSGAALSSDGMTHVLFGGYNNSGLSGGCEDSGTNFCGGTWVLSGGVWDRRCDGDDSCTAAPSERITSMVYDPEHDETVLFGGNDLGDSVGETWLWDGQSWRQPCLTGTCLAEPDGRRDHAMLWDTDRRKVLLVGGYRDGECDGAGFQRCQRAWEWDGQTWRLATQSDAHGDGYWPGWSPTTAAYDRGQKRAHLFDGQGLTFDGITYERQPPEEWFWRGGAEDRPGHLARFSLRAAAIPTGASLDSVVGRWIAGGEGGDQTSPTLGAQLWRWEGNRWRPVASHAAATTASQELVLILSDPEVIDRSLTRDAEWLTLAVTPTAPNGTLADRGAIVSDYVELTVSYQRP